MNVEALIHRVVARFAARYVNVPPMPLDACRHCGGRGINTEETLKVKSVCASCFGTGTDMKSFKALMDEAEDLTAQYENGMAQFRQDKKPYRGQSVPSFGQRGRGLQTLRITMTARQEQFKQEAARFDLGRKLARLAGAAAR